LNCCFPFTGQRPNRRKNRRRAASLRTCRRASSLRRRSHSAASSRSRREPGSKSATSSKQRSQIFNPGRCDPSRQPRTDDASARPRRNANRAASPKVSDISTHRGSCAAIPETNPSCAQIYSCEGRQRPLRNQAYCGFWAIQAERRPYYSGDPYKAAATRLRCRSTRTGSAKVECRMPYFNQAAATRLRHVSESRRNPGDNGRIADKNSDGQKGTRFPMALITHLTQARCDPRSDRGSPSSGGIITTASTAGHLRAPHVSAKDPRASRCTSSTREGQPRASAVAA
jgi:hypothetical protein